MQSNSHMIIAKVWLLLIVVSSVLFVCNGDKASIIVNPKYKPNAEINQIRDEMKSEARMISGTPQQMSDISKLRIEINSAVKTDKHAHTGEGKRQNFGLPKKINPWPPFFDLFKFFIETRQKERLTSKRLNLKEQDEFVGMVATAFNSTLNQTDIDYIKSELLKFEKSNDPDSSPNLMPNVVDSSVARKLKGTLHRKPVTAPPTHLHRETLQLLSVTEDLSFYLGVNILAWKTVQAAKKHVLVGITRKTILLVLEQKGRYEMVQELTFDSDISSFTVFMKWNGKAMEGYVVVGIKMQLVFVRIEETLRSMEIIWKWAIQQTVKTMTYFSLNGYDTLLLIHDSVDDGDVFNSADIYRIDIALKYTWLLQKIPLTAPCNSVESLDVGRDYVLIFAQNNTAELYRYSDGSAKSMQRFMHLVSIESPQIQTVASFRIGGLSYVAIGGRRPLILRYYREQFHAQTILSKSWGLVEHIVPIPARTYRDDLILFVQHRIELDSHSIPALEALIWNGQAFETAALSVPCMIGNVVIESGITCVLDFDRDEGISGSSIIQRGTDISLLVPRLRAPSGLFHLQFKLTPTKYPTNLQATDSDPYEQLQKVLTEQDNIVVEAEAAARNSISSEEGVVVADWSIDNLDAAEIQINEKSKLHVDQLYVGDKLWTNEDYDVDIPSLLATLDQYQSELDELEHSLKLDENSSKPIKLINNSQNGQFDVKTLRVLREKRTTKSLDLDKVHVKHLNVEFINGIAMENFIFLDADDKLDLSGSTLHATNVKVSEKVHILPAAVEHESLQSVEPKPDAVKMLHITGDVSVDNINGVSWDEFISRIVMTNLDYTFKDVQIDGEIIAQDALLIGSLNGMSFLNDFLWNFPDGETAIITGRKNFTRELRTSAIDTDSNGEIDRTRTFEVITLSGEQFISGDIAFNHLEVTEQLDVSGKVSGKHLDDFLANPNLMQTKQIASDCFFSNLHVEGPIYVRNKIHGIIIDEVLADVVYSSNPKTLCTSFKTFATLETIELQLTSNLLNDNDVQNYLTTDTEQFLNITEISGMLYFQNLQIDGLFDFVNVTELDANSIKLNGDQYTEAHLIFENNVDKSIGVQAEKLEVLKTINGIHIIDLLVTDEILVLDGDLLLNGALIDDLSQLNGDFSGNSDVVNEISLKELDETRMSYSRSQEITGSFHMRTAIIQEDFNAILINDYETSVLLKYIELIRKVPESLETDETFIARLTVTGNVEISKVNGHDFEVIKDNAIWLDRPNQIPGTLKFIDQVIVNGPLHVEWVNSNFFPDFMDGIVLRSALDGVYFTEPIRFANGFHVTNNITTSHIGIVATDNILKKTNTNAVAGNLHINGNVYARNVELKNYLNDVNFSRISKDYSFDDARQIHIIQRANFNYCQIDSIYLYSGLNGLPNVDTFLQSIVRTDASQLINGKKVLKGKISFDNDLYIFDYNGFELTTLLEQIVLNVNGEQATVMGNFAFSGKVNAKEITIRNNLMTNNVMGCRLVEWLNNTLRTDSDVSVAQHFYFEDGSFKASNVQSVVLNGLNMADVITKHTQQNITGVQYMSIVSSNAPITVSGLVNGVDLRYERENTVMVIEDHYITAKTSINSARVLESLKTLGTIYGKNLKKAAPLNGDILLNGAFSFGSVSFEALNTNELISGIDIDYWAERSLKRNAYHQVVNGSWSVDSLAITGGNIDGSGELNGLDIGEISNRLAGHKSHIEGILQAFHQDYRGLCGNVKELVKESNKVQYLVSHFEEVLKLHMDSGKIRSVHFVEAYGNKYLLSNVICTTYLYVWNKAQGRFVNLTSTDTGAVDQWIHAMDKFQQTIIISNSNDGRCHKFGLNIWNFSGDTMTHKTSLNELGKVSMIHTDNQLRPPPERFYALLTTGVVLELNLAGEMQDKWILPSLTQLNSDGSSEYRFLPSSVNLGLALSDGSRLSHLTSTKTPTTEKPGTRRKRTIDLIKEIITKTNEAQTNHTSPLAEFTKTMQSQLKDVSDNFVATNNQRFNTFRNIGIAQSEPGFFESGYSLENLMAPNFGNTSATKLNLLKLEPSQPIWPRKWDRTPGLGTAKDVSTSTLNNVSVTTSTEKVYEAQMSTMNYDTSEGELKNVSSITRIDSFGQIEELDEPVTEEIMEKQADVQEIKTENEDEALKIEEHNLEVAALVMEVPKAAPLEQGNRFSEPRTDLFGEIEEMAKPIVDDLMDTYVDIKDSKMGIDVEDVGTPAPESSITMPTALIVTSQSVQSVPEVMPTNFPTEVEDSSGQARTDLFGEIEEMAKPIVDDLMDTYVDMKDDKMGIDEDDVSSPVPRTESSSFIAKPITNINLKSNETEFGNVQQAKYPTGSRTDLFGQIEEFAKPIVDDVVDAYVDIKDNEMNIDADDARTPISATFATAPSTVTKIVNNYQSALENPDIYKPIQIEITTEPGTSVEMSASLPVTPYSDQITPNQQKILPTKVTDSSSDARTDLFGEIEEKAKPIVDDLMDAYVDIKDSKIDIDEDERIDEDNVGTSALNTSKTSSIPSDSEPTIISSSQTPFADSATNFNTVGNVTGDSRVGGIMSLFKDSIKDVWITYQEGKELIKDLRAEIHARARDENNRDSHRGAHSESNWDDDYVDDWYVNFANNATDNATGIREPKIAVPIIIEGGVSTMENTYLPGRESGEIVSLYVGGGYKKTLVAVSSETDHVVKGKHDVIRIYEDVIEGRLYQTIGCHQPRSLTAIHMRDETFLAFVEKESEVQIFIYRGIEGFTLFSQFSFPTRVTDMQIVMVPSMLPHACERTFLALSINQEIRFLEAIAIGYCGLEVSLDCN